MKRIICILAIVLAFSCILATFVGCEKEEEPVYTDYTVTIVDGLNTPIANVMVKFTYPDGTTKTRVTEGDGVASIKNVPAGEYKVRIEKGFSNAVITTADYTLTKNKTTLDLVVRDESKTFEIYGDLEGRSYAYNIGVGSYDIPCEKGQTAYFVFYAQQSGTYKVTLTSEKNNMTVGYYGIPMFVQSTHRGDGDYDGKTFELAIYDNQTPYVIGVSTEEWAVGSLTVERTGDAPFDPQYAPWTTVSAEGEIPKCDLPVGTVLTDLDIANPNLSVTLGEDGYYYTADGKLVYLRIGSISDAKYLDVSIAHIAGLIDDNFGQNFGGYVYDENGEFVGKYSFNTMLESYYEMCDANGVYPLTEELVRAIQVHGNSVGWWKPGTANYLFEGKAVILDNAWLFLCCTAN